MLFDAARAVEQPVRTYQFVPLIDRDDPMEPCILCSYNALDQGNAQQRALVAQIEECAFILTMVAEQERANKAFEFYEAKKYLLPEADRHYTRESIYNHLIGRHHTPVPALIMPRAKNMTYAAALVLADQFRRKSVQTGEELPANIPAGMLMIKMLEFACDRGKGAK